MTRWVTVGRFAPATPPARSPLPRPLGATHPERARQELVFIGVNMDREAITLLLDGCLLSDSEMAEYRKRERDETSG